MAAVTLCVSCLRSCARSVREHTSAHQTLDSQFRYRFFSHLKTFLPNVALSIVHGTAINKKKNVYLNDVGWTVLEAIFGTKERGRKLEKDEMKKKKNFFTVVKKSLSENTDLCASGRVVLYSWQGLLREFRRFMRQVRALFCSKRVFYRALSWWKLLSTSLAKVLLHDCSRSPEGPYVCNI